MKERKLRSIETEIGFHFLLVQKSHDSYVPEDGKRMKSCTKERRGERK